MPQLKKYTDWRTWWDGLRTNLMKCAGTTGTSWLGSNAVGATIPALSDIKMNWHQAIGLFGVHMGIEIFAYMRDNQPKVITETIETSFESKDEAGKTIVQASKTTTETPVTKSP